LLRRLTAIGSRCPKGLTDAYPLREVNFACALAVSGETFAPPSEQFQSEIALKFILNVPIRSP
jgi:hypothetical protein